MSVHFSSRRSAADDAMMNRSSLVVRRLAAALSLALTVGACGDVLEVSNEQDILDENLDSPEAVTPLMNGVIGDYALAYANAIDIVGLFGQELIHTGSFPTWRVRVVSRDRRLVRRVLSLAARSAQNARRTPQRSLRPDS